MKKKIILALIGALVPIFFILFITAVICAVVGGSSALNQSTNIENSSLSEQVLSYQPIVSKYCTKYKIPDYVELVLAVIQTESGGVGNDPMQSSECPLNIKYPQKHNGITNPEYSIQVGIQYLESCLRAAKCKSPTDIQHISLALQGYNYGGGYIDWAISKGGYSKENALEFSQMKAQQMGLKSYGAPDYVSHVLSYYSCIDSSGGGFFTCPISFGQYRITSGFGFREGKLHKGIDLAAPEGTKIYASASGTVVFSDYGQYGTGYGGYGNVVMIKHDETYSTLYGHCSKLLVHTGTKVQKGDAIALVGNTGDSSGNHLHFEIRANDDAVNPLPYFSMQKKVEDV